MRQQTIELDCSPGGKRPNEFISDIVKELNIDHDKLEERVKNRFFGNWEYDFSDVPEDEWDLNKPKFKERIKSLYNRGCIRYGSW